jgi:hypothetical protein
MLVRKIVARPYLYIVLCIIILLSTAVYVAKAQTPNTGTPACYNSSDGTLRVLLSGTCKKSEINIKLQTGDMPVPVSGVQTLKYEFDLAPGDTYTIPITIVDMPVAITMFTTNVIVTRDDGSIQQEKPLTYSYTDSYDSATGMWTTGDTYYLYLWGQDSSIRKWVKGEIVGKEMNISFTDNPWLGCSGGGYPAPCSYGNITSPVHIHIIFMY